MSPQSRVRGSRPRRRRLRGPLDGPGLGTRKDAHFTPDPNAPPLPSGDKITHVPSSSGTLETLLIEGGDKLPTVLIGGQPAPIGASRLVLVNVPPGSDA